MKLEIHAQGMHVGTLEHDRERQQWRFDYSSTWLQWENRYPLSPALPLEWPIGSALPRAAEQHSLLVRTFFENLLPEGQALDDAAAATKISKAESFGLLAALGRETAGALEVVSSNTEMRAAAEPVFRPVTREQLSERIRARPHEPFTVWDGRVRLSIAGYQDKLAVYEDAGGNWSLVEGSTIASTHLIKPEPVRAALAGMTSNERLCMQIASHLGIPAAHTRLVHVPEPVLLIERFDRRRTAAGVDRLHCVDGCQALGLPVGMKYERPYGNNDSVKAIRDGASLRTLFELVRVHSPRPAAASIALLRWTIFQTLIGNTDAHAKNISFFVTGAGLVIAPAYDLVCSLEYKDIDDHLAMAIGDEFSPRSQSAFDWAQFAHECKLPPRVVARHLGELALRARDALPAAARQVHEEGGRNDTIDHVTEIVRTQIEMLGRLAPGVVDVPAEMF